MNKFTFNARVTGYISKHAIRQDIIESMESSPEFRKEIARVFQQANRRIQNIEKSGRFSPAVESLGDRGSGYSKFRLSGNDWHALKTEYGRAIAFLQQPTSTATGAKSYNEQIKKRYNLTDLEFDTLANEYLGNMHSLHGTDFVDKYLKRYKDFSGEFTQVMATAGQQMETDAKTLSDNLQKQVDRMAENISDAFDHAIKTLEKGFDIPF